MRQARILKGGSRNPDAALSTPCLLSIITVCYNASATLERTIASIRSQSNQNFEYIIIDGGSQDGTIDILQRHDSNIDMWLSEPDHGIYDAMNKGAKLARGAYLSFLNADDRYSPDTVQTVLEAIESSRADVYHGNMIKERTIGDQTYTRLETPNPDMMPKGMGVFHPSSFVSALLFKEMGGFDIRYKLAADYDLFLKLWLSGAKFQYLDTPLSFFSLGGASNSGCGTYAEAALIQKRQGTDTYRKTQFMYMKCRIKMFLSRLVFTLAPFLNLKDKLEAKRANRWK